jgi:hypothetical protein
MTLRELLKTIEDMGIVTALDVATLCGITIDQASAVLKSLPLDNPAGVGVFPWPENTTLDEMCGKVENPSEGLLAYAEKINPSTSEVPPGYYGNVLCSLSSMQSVLDEIRQKMDALMSTDNGNKPRKTRRRGRGELFRQTPNDPPELVKARREGDMEVAAAKATGTRKEVDKVYARHCNRINTLEQRFQVGAYAPGADDDSDDSDSENAAE